MSRCFSYPPPGSVKKEISVEAWIEPIKLQGEAKKAKKEKKREKKREKKEKKARENGEIEDKKQHHKKVNKVEREQKGESKEHGKKREREAELLDRRTSSTLTEEYPVGSQNSSDSTLNSNNSNKRQKPNLSPECRQKNGSILRIRLPLQRHKDHEVLPREELPSRLPPHNNNVPVEQSSRLPLQKTIPPEVSTGETLPGRLPILCNKVEQPFRLPLQRTNAPEVSPREKLPSQLPLQRNKDLTVLAMEQLLCRLPVQKNKRPEVLPKDEQPCRLPLKIQKELPLLVQDRQPSLKRQKDQEVLPKEKKARLLSLQRTKDPEVLHRETQQPSSLPLQTNKDQKVVPKEKQLSQLPLQRNKDPAVLSKEEKPSELLVQKQIVPPVREEQPCSVSGRTADASVLGRSEPADAGEKPCSTSRGEGKEERKSRRRASQYRELFEKWVEPPLLLGLLPTDVDDDQGWLLKTNKNRNCGVEKPVTAGDSLICGDSVSWPRAQLLPEVDLYALPYTVPF